jgi:hypothetical protein
MCKILKQMFFANGFVRERRAPTLRVWGVHVYVFIFMFAAFLVTKRLTKADKADAPILSASFFTF